MNSSGLKRATLLLGLGGLLLLLWWNLARTPEFQLPQARPKTAAGSSLAKTSLAAPAPGSQSAEAPGTGRSWPKDASGRYIPAVLPPGPDLDDAKLEEDWLHCSRSTLATLQENYSQWPGGGIDVRAGLHLSALPPAVARRPAARSTLAAAQVQSPSTQSAPPAGPLGSIGSSAVSQLTGSSFTDTLLTSDGLDNTFFQTTNADTLSALAPANVQAVIDALTVLADPAADLVANNSQISRGLYYLRAANYVNFYTGGTRYTADLKTNVRSLLVTLGSHPGFLTAGFASARVEWMVECGNWLAMGQQMTLLTQMLRRYYDTPALQTGNIDEYNTILYLLSGLATTADNDPNFAGGYSTDLMNAMEDYAVHMPDTGDTDGLILNAIYTLGYLRTYDPVSAYQGRAHQILTEAYQQRPMDSPPYLETLLMLEPYPYYKRLADGTPIDINAYRADLANRVFSNTYSYDDGTMVFRTPLPADKISRLYDALREVKAQFFRLTQALRPADSDPHTTLTLRIYGTMADYHKYQGFLYGLASNNGGIYIENWATFFTYERTAAESYYTLEELTRHEYVHYLDGYSLLTPSFGASPFYDHERLTWHSEGLAEFLDGSRRTAGIPVRSRMISLVEGYGPMTISQLIGGTYAKASQVYPNGALFFDFLMERHPDKLWQYFRTLYEDGTNPANYDTLTQGWRADAALNTEFQSFLDSVWSEVIAGTRLTAEDVPTGYQPAVLYGTTADNIESQIETVLPAGTITTSGNRFHYQATASVAVPDGKPETLRTTLTNNLDQALRDLTPLDDHFACTTGWFEMGSISNQSCSVTYHLASWYNPDTQTPQIRPPKLTSGNYPQIGAPLTLTVTPNGTAPFSYQWAKNGFTLPGATEATYHLSQVSQADAGWYVVTIIDADGHQTQATSFVVPHYAATTLWAWGDNASGQTSVPAGLDNAVAVAAGDHFALALKADGTVSAWGSNSSLQCRIPYGLSQVVAISAQGSGAAALKQDGTVVTWGGAATAPSGLNGIVSLACGLSHLLALKSDSTVVAWGSDTSGQTDVPAGLSGVVAVAAGYSHSLALKADGTVVAWGNNSSQQTNVPAGLSGVVAIAAGCYYSVAVKSDGTVVAWGGSTPPAGLSGVVGVSSGFYVNLGLRGNGTVAAWGLNDQGQTTVPPALAHAFAVATGSGFSLALADGYPAITTAPQSQSVTVGQAASFSVVVQSPLVCSYQWRKDGADLPGATASSFSLAQTQFTDAGSYDVLVTNSIGSTTSSAALLAVNPIPVAPSFTTQPVSQSVSVGQSVTFTAAASGTPAPSYQWKKGGVDLPNSTASSYTLSSVQTADAGSYTVMATNTGGNVTSAPATLTVIAAPSITPSSFPLVGAPLSLAVTATGTGPFTYQWTKNGQPLTGVTGATYDLPSVGLTDAGWYAVTIGDAVGGSAQVVTFVRPCYPSSTITAWGANDKGQATVPTGLHDAVAVAAGDRFALALHSDGTVTAWGDNASHQCNVPANLANVVSVAAFGTQAVALKQDGTVSVWGSTSAAPNGLAHVVAVAAGLNHVLALKSDGTVTAWGNNTSGQATVPSGLSGVVAIAAGYAHSLALKSDGTVVAWGTNANNQLNIPSGLSSVVSIAAGSYYSLAVAANGTVTAWGSGPSTPQGTTGVQTVSCNYHNNLALKKDGTVSVWGLNDYNQNVVPSPLTHVFSAGMGSSFCLALSADFPAILTPPAGQSVVVGQSASFQVSATSPIALSYQWRKDGSPITGAINATYGLSAVQLTDAGSYDVVVSNAVGSTTSSGATLTVTPAPVAPSFSTDPAAQTVSAGDAVTFTSLATGYPQPTYKWQKGGVDIPGATQATYSLASVQVSDAGIYRVVASNASGTANSQTATLVVNPVPVAPAFTTQPVNQTVISGQPFSFSATASGYPAPSYQWSKAGTAIPGATSSTYSVSSAQSSDAGTYMVTASNASGSSNSNQVTLTVHVAPSFTQQPADLTVSLGHSASFTASASGTPTPTYQWKKGDVDIPNATAATYSLSSVTLADAAIYTVTATNSAGSSTSQNATLTVLPPPSLPARLTPLVGSPLTLSVTAYGTAPYTYQWSKNGQDLASSSSAFLSFATLSLSDAGWYRVSILDAEGRPSQAGCFVLPRYAVSTLWAWGSNAQGQITVPSGLDTTVAIAAGASFALALKADGTVTAWGSNSSGACNVPSGLSGVVALAAGGSQAVALRQDGTVAAWGSAATPPGSLAGVIGIAAGLYHALALKSDGTVAAWGSNTGGQCNVPAGLSGVAAVAGGYFHSLALKSDGTVVGWGSNANGQLNIPAGLQNVVAIAAGSYFSVAVKADGKVLCWGGGPLVPASLAGAQAVSASYYTTVALRADHSVAAWGQNSSGETTVPTGLVNALAIAAGDAFSLALATPCPIFSVQPLSQALSVGSQLTLTAAASGIPAPSYQWQKDGADLPGANGASYSVSGVQTGDAGTYQIIATNSAGTATSQNAVVSVAKLTQTISFPGPSDQAFSFAPITLSATATSGQPVVFSLLSGPATLNDSALTLTGTGPISLRASQAGNTSYAPATEVDRSFTVTANFDAWRQAHFTTVELSNLSLSGDLAVYGQDGLTNLLKYALGLQPKQNSVSGLPTLSIVGTEWIYTYTRPAGLPDVTYTVEYSNDLAHWTTSGVTHEQVSNSGGVETWRARVSPGAPRAFFRLRVDRP